MNEAVVEGMGSIVDRHATSQRHLPQEKYVMESIIDWNGPTTNNCESFLTEALNLHFSQHNADRGKGEWHFTSTDSKSRFTKFVTSEVIDRLKKEESNFDLN